MPTGSPNHQNGHDRARTTDQLLQQAAERARAIGDVQLADEFENAIHLHNTTGCNHASGCYYTTITTNYLESTSNQAHGTHASDINLEHIRLLRLQPDDIIVLTTPRALSAQEADELKATLSERFPDNGIVVLTNGLDIAVVRESQATP